MINPEDWNPTNGIVLEPYALKAVVASQGSVIVAAGPGAGKTELLAQRADFLFRTGLCPYPRRILAISFKVDAARNLHKRVRIRSGGKYAVRFDSLTFHAFSKRIIDNFRPALTGKHELCPDYTIHEKESRLPYQIAFKDMVPLALEILEKNPYALGGIQQTYSHVFLDEFQDATSEQYELLLTMFSESTTLLTAVGDVKQRIMAFAGALDGVMEKFATDFDALRFSLCQNRRSESALQRMQNRMIRDMDPEAVNPEGAVVGETGEIEVLDFATATDEAEYIAKLIDEQLTSGIQVSEIAVLVRQQASLVAAELFDALAVRGIPFRNDQTRQDLAAEPVAALVFNFIQVLSGIHEPAAYSELMRVVFSSAMDEERAGQLDRKIKHHFKHVVTALLNNPSFRTDIHFWRREILSFLELVSRPTLLALSPEYAQGNRLQELINEVIKAFEEVLMSAKDPLDAVRQLTDAGAVRVLTIHKSKGLEFQHVIILGVEEELFWGSLNEARAEYFVAISRAKSRLTLTYTRFRARPQGFSGRWCSHRTPCITFLDYANDKGGSG